MIYLLFVTMLWAHEDLPNQECKMGEAILKIQMKTDKTYDVTLPGAERPTNFGKPKIEDKFDAKLKQLFDTYTFKAKAGALVVKRPETKGQVTQPFALWKGKKFHCASAAPSHKKEKSQAH